MMQHSSFSPGEHTMSKTPEDISRALSEPFPETQLRWKPKSVSGSKCLALPYLTAAAVVARLTEVLGADGWEDSYQVLPSGAVICQLRCRLGEVWITRQDVGIPSQQEAIKGCFSDSLKRVARKFSVGLYLTRLGGQWLDYAPKTKQITGKPRLPVWAQPGGKPQPAPPATANSKQPQSGQLENKTSTPRTFPESGTELESRLADYDQDLSEQGLFPPGELLGHVLEVVSKAGPKPGVTYGTDVRTWPARAIKLAIDETKRFEQRARAEASRKTQILNGMAKED
jgi:hypothetical protein